MSNLSDYVTPVRVWPNVAGLPYDGVAAVLGISVSLGFYSAQTEGFSKRMERTVVREQRQL